MSLESDYEKIFCMRIVVHVVHLMRNETHAHATSLEQESRHAANLPIFYATITLTGTNITHTHNACCLYVII